MQFGHTFMIPRPSALANAPALRVITDHGQPRTLGVRPMDAVEQRLGVRDFVLFGEGWRRNREALSAGLRYRDAMVVDLLARHIPPLVDEPEQRVLSYLHAKPLSGPPAGVATMRSRTEPIDVITLLNDVEHFVAADCVMTARELTAVRLLYASMCQTTLEVRFILQFIAVEVLLERGDHVDSVLALLDTFVAIVDRAENLTRAEKESFIVSLNGLRAESVGGAGRRLVRERLGLRKYAGLRADKFFNKCYDIRNHLMHGSFDELDYQELCALVETLETFVPDLIACRYP